MEHQWPPRPNKVSEKDTDTEFLSNQQTGKDHIEMDTDMETHGC